MPGLPTQHNLFSRFVTLRSIANALLWQEQQNGIIWPRLTKACALPDLLDSNVTHISFSFRTDGVCRSLLRVVVYTGSSRSRFSSYVSTHTIARTISYSRKHRNLPAAFRAQASSPW